MKVAIYPGSFDPVTNGHIDIIERGVRLCDRLVVAVAQNSGKKPLFTVAERLELITASITSIGGFIDVVSFDTLLIDYCRQNKITTIIRGLRSITDFEYEMTIASANKKLAPELETVFMMTSGENYFISSNIVREVSSYGGDISSFVPPAVVTRIQQKQSSIQ